MKYLLAVYLFSAIGSFLVVLSFIKNVSKHFRKENKNCPISFKGYLLAFIYSLIPIINSILFYSTLKNYDSFLSRVINNLKH